MKQIILSILLFLSPLHAFSQEPNNYEFCEIYGIAGSANDSFTQTLASRILEKHGLLYDSICSDISQGAYKFGQQYSSGSITDSANTQRWQKYQKFRNKIADKIIEISGY